MSQVTLHTLLDTKEKGKTKGSALTIEYSEIT